MANNLEIFSGIAAVLILLYYYFTATFNFWKSRGVPGPEPIPVFGNILSSMFGKIPLVDFLTALHKQYKTEPFVGIFTRRTPVLVVQDPDYIRDILIKDFPKFADRGFYRSENKEPLTQHLFSLEEKRWRVLRSQFTPVFTSGKLKGTFSLILDCANHFDKYLSKLVDQGGPIDCREVAAQYTTDVIGSCAFGIEMNSLSEKESDFRRIGKKIFNTGITGLLKLRVQECAAWLYDFLGYFTPYNEETKFITKIVMDTIEYRKENNIVRPDFMNTLMELQKHPERLGDVKLTNFLLAAQGYIFFVAGFETSSATISNCLYELAQNHDVQDKLREEIKEHSVKNEGDWTYENIKELKYLDKVFRETLRKYPPLAYLMRRSTEDYTFRNTKLSIPKGTVIWIPIQALQRDPDIYPNPALFDPERFQEDTFKARHPMYYLPFGTGPRNCIGSRFAVYQTKIGIIKNVLNYKIDVCEKTPIPYVYNPVAIILCPKDKLYLKLTKVEK